MAIGTLIQAGLGAAQMIGGLFMKNPKLPEYQIAGEAKANLNESLMMRNQGLSSGTMDYLNKSTDRSLATAMSAGGDRRGGLGLIASVSQQRLDQATNVAKMNEDMRRENLNRVFSARSQMITERNKEFEVRRSNIAEQRDKRAQMIGSGMQNIMGAVGTQSIADSVTGENSFANIFGGGGKKSGFTNPFLSNKGLSLGSNKISAKTYNPSTGKYE